MKGMVFTYRITCWSLLSLLTLFADSLFAQQEWSYTQYQFNLYDANSAYAGNHQTMSMAVRHRSQWIGLEGAPVTDQISVHAPLVGNRLGVGLRVVSDLIGARKQQLFRTSAAYKLEALRGQVAFAITAGVLRSAVDRSELIAFDMNDAQLLQIGAAHVTPVFGAALFYASKRLFIGAETGSLNRPANSSAEGSMARLYRNANLIAGLMQPIGESDALEFSTQTKWSEGRQRQSEVNVQYLYHNKFRLGAGYRFGSAWQMLFSWMVNEQFRIGMSYDNTLGQLMNCNQSSAELFLGYTLHKRAAGAVRYF
jgi:type IX secretion system PorP/SprF family membrane protein